MRPFLLVAFPILLAAARPAAAAPEGVDRLAWLAGCWRAEGAEAGSGEQWLAPAGGTLLGVSRTVKNGATVAHEFMQIRAAEGGGLVFIAQPSGKPEGSFVLLPGAAAEAVFENLQHDFPQRVIYRLEDGGRLRARIEGQRNGQLRGADFPMQRVPCDPPAPRPEAFQGLPWGADEAQLLQRFGAGLKQVDCGTPQRRPAPRLGEACDHPMLAPYDVAGVPFRLNLHVDERLRQLVRVSLAWDGVVAAGSDNGFSEKHRQLRQLLSQRYGSPESTHVANEPDAWNAVARWRRGDTVIELNSVFRPRSAAGPARETVEITYLPVTAGDAGKL